MCIAVDRAPLALGVSSLFLDAFATLKFETGLINSHTYLRNETGRFGKGLTRANATHLTKVVVESVSLSAGWLMRTRWAREKTRMCLDAFDESNESRERRNREFIYGLRGLASQSDWTLRYPSAKFPTVVNQLREARTGDVGSCGEGAAMPRPWSKHMMWLATVSSALVQASRDLKEFDIADFIVAGSLGKDTAVEHCTTDVDLLLVFKTFDPSRYCKYLKFIEDALLHGLNASDFQVTRKTFPVRNIGVEKSSQAVRESNDDLPWVEGTYLRVVGKEGEIVEILPGGAMAEISAVIRKLSRCFVEHLFEKKKA